MKKAVNTIKNNGVTVWINLILLGAAITLLFYYVLIADRIASKNYRIQSLQDKIESLSEANSSLMSKKLSIDTPKLIMEFAQSRNLVEAKNISYIFENKNVAKK